MQSILICGLERLIGCMLNGAPIVADKLDKRHRLWLLHDAGDQGNRTVYPTRDTGGLCGRWCSRRCTPRSGSAGRWAQGVALLDQGLQDSGQSFRRMQCGIVKEDDGTWLDLFSSPDARSHPPGSPSSPGCPRPTGWVPYRWSAPPGWRCRRSLHKGGGPRWGACR